MREFKRRMKHMYYRNPPTQLDQTIPVRAHWRRGKNHLDGQPLLKELVVEEVKRLIRLDSP
jgi:hypothetical protein